VVAAVVVSTRPFVSMSSRCLSGKKAYFIPFCAPLVAGDPRSSGHQGFVPSMGFIGSMGFMGSIGFIGLVVPHIVRLVLRRTVDALILPVFFSGGLFLLLCDILSRILPTFSPLPVGIVTSMVGGAIFIVILLKR